MEVSCTFCLRVFELIQIPHDRFRHLALRRKAWPGEAMSTYQAQRRIGRA